MRNLVFVFTLFFHLSLFAQKPLCYIYDRNTLKLDSIVSFEYDKSIVSDRTNYKAVTDIQYLYEAIDTFKTHNESDFTLKYKVAEHFDINKFPLTAAIKTLTIKNEQIKGHCSAIMVSPKHILTAAHCHSTFGNQVGPHLQLLNQDSTFFACPAFDGSLNQNFDCSNISKLYIFNYADIALLELEDPIGYQTGWVGTEFDTEIDLKTSYFYNFSYPGPVRYPITLLDSSIYNGDTLYFKMGNATSTNNKSIVIQDSFGNPGESGSALMRVINDEAYYTNAIMCCGGLIFDKLVPEIFFTIKSIISESINVVNDHKQESISIFPNPTKDIVHIVFDETSYSSIKIFDWNGNLLVTKTISEDSHQLDFNNKPDGVYYLLFESISGLKMKKIIKI